MRIQLALAWGLRETGYPSVPLALVGILAMAITSNGQSMNIQASIHLSYALPCY
jgi:hypothetical protein